jgi:hypothetical protein
MSAITLTAGHGYRLIGRVQAAVTTPRRVTVILRPQASAVWAIPVALLSAFVLWMLLTAFLPSPGIKFCRDAIARAVEAGR